MKTRRIQVYISTILIVALLPIIAVAQQAKNPRYPDTLQGESVERLTRGNTALDKLTPELQSLFRQFSANRNAAAKAKKFSETDLKKRFGLNAGDLNPAIEIAIEVAPDTDTATLEKIGATIRLVSHQTVYASLPVLQLETLAQNENVIAVSSVKAARLPEIPRAQNAPRLSLPDLTRGMTPLANAFDAQGLTGKGVIIGILDTGIDWRHQDFINADGTSRILYLYDPFDQSFTTSQGRIGSRPPINDAKEQPLGTLYTRQQINAALKAQGAVHSTDRNGHGTAVAGTAAGNGRATANGVPAGHYNGAAPEADLIIVKAVPDSASENVFPYYLAARWVVETAKAAGQACVLNLSLGNHYSAHDGNDAVEAMFNELAGEGKPGVVICVAAGNEGKYSFHAGGTFGPRRAGQADVISPPIELFVARPTQLSAYFDHADDWGLIVSGLDNFFVDDKSHSLDAYFYNVEGRFQTKLSATAKAPASFSQYVQNSVEIEAPMKSAKSAAKSSASSSSTLSGASSAMERNAASDRLVLTLQPGKYIVRGFGATQRVVNGRFDLYLDSYSEASFGNGAEAKFMIASPGNAANVLTIGAYDFRNQWENLAGKQTSYNLNLGDLSDYSSPGYRRDGIIKPDIIAPATYTIASLAAGAMLAKDESGNLDQNLITRDGQHLAWSGTSAASPFVAGVVALLLQKNPRLDAAQARDLLARTAITDSFTGAVPNPRWGYGKINPDAAIKATREEVNAVEVSASSPAAKPTASSPVPVIVGAARSQILRELENPNRDSPISIALRVVPVEVELDDRGRVRRVIGDKEISQTNNERMILTEGDFVMLEVKNTGSFDAYVTIFDLRSDGKIAPLFPHPAIKIYDNKIAASGKWQRLPLPFIFHIEKPYGAEIFKAIATAEKSNFSALLDAETFTRGVDAEAALSPLGQLLKAAMAGHRATLAAVAPDGWATAAITFEVVPRKD